MKRSRLPLLVTVLVLIFFYLPIIVLIVNSFNDSRFGGTWEGFSLRWYARLVSEREIWSALENTLIVGIAATAVSTVLGTMAAFALHRYASTLQKAHYMLIYTPLVVPEVLMGMSLLLLFVAAGMSLGLVTIFLAHVTFCISYVAMVVLGRLQDFDFSIVEAARDLGAGWWTTTWRVLLPLLAPGILAGALLAFTLSVDDFVISFFVAGPGSTTLPIRIYSMIKHGSPPLINALSTVLLVVTFTLLFITQHLVEERRK
ncbi:MAG: ABC transporter permease [Acidobacteria bacterium]|nr:MAG: ABC transporter permease [Acidobacteriota bacterium]